jgi:hypothetical protein
MWFSVMDIIENERRIPTFADVNHKNKETHHFK